MRCISQSNRHRKLAESLRWREGRSIRIFAFESSAKAASAALMEDGVLLAEDFRNNGKTHSVTLMPMAEEILKDCSLTAADIDCVAVSIGPGSFTGIRIGLAAAKGFAWAAEKSCCGVSTLEAMAYLLRPVSGLLCPVMDARRAQVYNALFRSDGTAIIRMTEDRAVSLENLGQELLSYDEPIYLVGDGAAMFRRMLAGTIPDFMFPPPHLEHQRAAGVAMAAEQKIARGETVPPEALLPNYLRLSQAERERLDRQARLKGDA